MKSTVLIFCMLTACSAIFFPFISLPNQRSLMNICIYSTNPNRYQPKCFMCPSSVYPNVLRACLNAAAIPSNISYTQAACIEQNCMISRGRRSIDSKLDNDENQIHDNHHSEGNEESPSDNIKGLLQDNAASSDQSQVMETKHLFASDDADYETEDYELENS